MTEINEKLYIQARRSHWESMAENKYWEKGIGKNYHQDLNRIYSRLITPGQRVLEIGSGIGDLIAQLQPSYGLGIDFSNKIIEEAKIRHFKKTNLQFICCEAEKLACIEKFDAIILSDLVNDLWDVQKLISRLHEWCHPRTRIFINSYSRVWQPALTAARWMGQATALLPQNWLVVEDIANILYLEEFEVINHFSEILFPLNIKFVSKPANRFFAKIFPFSAFDLTNIVIARPNPRPISKRPVVSVIVAARNEDGNIGEIFRRMPEMGAGTELIFVEGWSKDNTCQTIEKEMEKHRDKNVKLFIQPGKGKGDAVRKGFSEAKGEILMILDADLTVIPEDLPRFYEAIVSGRGEFINGVRLVYPMEKKAMKFFNIIGNKFFSLAFSWLIGQPIKDTLCGTKVLWKKDYEKIVDNRAYFGDFDPFGDFDLIFGAARLNLKILDLPIRYRERQYGTTNISRWRHGILLLKMVVFAAFKMKFV